MRTKFRLRMWSPLLAVMLLVTCVTTLPAQEAATEPAAELDVGDAAPDFKLPTFDDKLVTLSEHVGEDGHPVILLFSRANW